MSAINWVGVVGGGAVLLMILVQAYRVRKGGRLTTAYAAITALVAIATMGALLALGKASGEVVTAFFTLAGTIAGVTANVVRDNQPTSSKSATTTRQEP